MKFQGTTFYMTQRADWKIRKRRIHVRNSHLRIIRGRLVVYAEPHTEADANAATIRTQKRETGDDSLDSVY